MTVLKLLGLWLIDIVMAILMFFMLFILLLTFKKYLKCVIYFTKKREDFHDYLFGLIFKS